MPPLSSEDFVVFYESDYQNKILSLLPTVMSIL